MFSVAHTFLTHAERDTIAPLRVQSPKSPHSHDHTEVARLLATRLTAKVGLFELKWDGFRANRR